MTSTLVKKSLIIAFSTSLIAGIYTVQADTTKIGQGEGQLDVIAWPGYLERGESDKNYEKIAKNVIKEVVIEK